MDQGYHVIVNSRVVSLQRPSLKLWVVESLAKGLLSKPHVLISKLECLFQIAF